MELAFPPEEIFMASELTPVPDDLDFGVTIRGLVDSQQVFGRYTLKHVLGRGGMGVVWLAHDERLDREVALKFLPDAVNFDPSALDDLKRETRRCLELTHPNIIRIYDFVKDPQAAAISMEYIDGKTLAALRVEKEHRVFEVEEIRDWIAKACGALYYAHEEVKVVHRDLKPANLMLTSRGQIKIADFGIARSVSDSMTQVTMRRGTSGTLVYMSPQQMNGDMSRVTDDIYALGATIYEFLTSKPPFYSGDIPFQVRSATPRPMAERRHELDISGNGIPPEWEDAVAACLAKTPEQRPGNMLELADRLQLNIGTARTHGTTAAAQTTVNAKTKASVPEPKPPKIPRKPFPTKRVLQIAGGVAGLALVGWLTWSFILWPFIATPGELLVTSNPLGATVHISGQTDQVTPADFSHIRIGTYKITISEEGYDKADDTEKITEGEKKNLGTIQLKRAYGKLNLVTLPAHAHYVLAGAATTGNFSKEGSTPDFLSMLPSGSYQLTLSEPGFPPYTEKIEVPAHDLKTEKADLVQLAVAADASPDPAKVLHGDLDAGQLDAKGKTELVQLLNSAFTKYLSYGLLSAAADQLTKLKNMGQDIQAQQKELTDKRTSTEKEIAAQISSLISDKKCATAQEQLKNLDGVLEKESVDRLTAQFQAPLAQYQQQVDAAIKMSQDGPPAAAYDQLKTFASPYPDDLHLQLALAEVQTRMPPDHNRLIAQLKAFRQFAAQNKDFAADPALLAMQDKFANELKQLDALASALADAKNGPASVRSQIASLESQKASLERRRVGEANADALTQTANLFGRVITGHPVVNTGLFFSSDEAKQQAINNVQAQIDNEQQSLNQPQGSVEEAQKRYDEFVAHVPWGQD